MGKSFYRLRKEASEGYVFTDVCHSVTERGRGVTPNAYHGIGHMVTGGGQRSTTPPGQDHHLPPPWTGPHPSIHTGTTVNGRVVRILLECILVAINVQ